MKQIFVLVAMLLTLACAHDAEQSSLAGRGLQVDRLFDHDGVTVYRFNDAGHYHYYAVPRSGVSASTFSEWVEQCGKNCTRTVTDELQTVARR